MLELMINMKIYNSTFVKNQLTKYMWVYAWSLFCSTGLFVSTRDCITLS